MTIYGYARVSTHQQSLKEQIDELKKASVEDNNIYSEKFTGTTTSRPQFENLISLLKPGDTLVVTKLDRFARNTREALNVIEPLMDNNITIRVLNLATIENSPIGKMIVRTLLSVAEMERDMIVERTQTGKEFAKKNNPNFKEGRPKKRIGNFEKAIYEYYQSHSVKETISAFNTSKSTLFRIKNKIEKGNISNE